MTAKPRVSESGRFSDILQRTLTIFQLFHRLFERLVLSPVQIQTRAAAFAPALSYPRCKALETLIRIRVCSILTIDIRNVSNRGGIVLNLGTFQKARRKVGSGLFSKKGNTFFGSRNFGHQPESAGKTLRIVNLELYLNEESLLQLVRQMDTWLSHKPSCFFEGRFLPSPLETIWQT
jgi:hypothetical protein